MDLFHRPKHRKNDGVIAANRHRRQTMGQKVVGECLDPGDRVVLVERVGGDVAKVVDAQRVERRGSRGHVVGPNHYRLLANAARPKAGAGSIGRTEVKGHTEDTDVEIRRLGPVGQPHKRGNTAETGHVVASEWLRVSRLVGVGINRHQNSLPPAFQKTNRRAQPGN